MKLSYNWLSKYVDLKDITPEYLAKALTNAGLEVEGIEYQGKAEGLIIGEINQCVKHPDADHLNLCQVNIGNKVLDIVCGAPNARAGLKVIVAQVGAKLPSMIIKAGEIRGQASNGMLCSLLEIGVNEKYLTKMQIEGIEELAGDAVVGNADVLAYLGLDDVILDVGLTPNRADFMAMLSAAYEVGAILKRPTTLPSFDCETNKTPTNLKVSSTTAKCPLILGQFVGKVKIGASPKWMVDALHASGIKSINNVVDISNYVMLETGQPLHFYDAAKNLNKTLMVLDNQEMEYCALDGNAYQIMKEDIIISNGSECVGIGGIMGGEDSKIDDNTTSIIIEAASFNHVSIRNAARRFNLNTDASTRFSKGIEPLAPYSAMCRAITLLKDLAQASAIEEMVEYGSNNYTPTIFSFELAFINERLGTSYLLEEVVEVLERLHFNPEVNNQMIKVTIPSYRPDITIKDDISEEVIRLLGYDSLKSTLPKMEMTLGALDTVQSKRRLVERVLCDLGLQQIISYSLVSDNHETLAIMPLGDSIALASPLSEERKKLRASLLPSMLDTLTYNVARNTYDVNMFELSSVYAKGLVQERLGIVMCGTLQQLPWMKVKVNSDYYTLKGIIETMLERLGFDSNRVFIKENTLDTKNFHPNISACIYIGGDLLGIFGLAHPLICKAHDVKQCVMAELNFDLLAKTRASKIKFNPLPKFPSSKRDLALVVDKNISVKEIVELIKKNSNSLVKDVMLFDIYEGENVQADKKSVALSIIYHSIDKTLSDNDILPINDKIIKVLETQLDAKLRT